MTLALLPRATLWTLLRTVEIPSKYFLSILSHARLIALSLVLSSCPKSSWEGRNLNIVLPDHHNSTECKIVQARDKLVYQAHN